MELLDAEVTAGLAAVDHRTPLQRGRGDRAAAGWLAQAASEARARGALFILDEAQTGLAKLGTMWAFEQEAVLPDVLTVSKHFGGGIADQRRCHERRDRGGGSRARVQLRTLALERSARLRRRLGDPRGDRRGAASPNGRVEIGRWLRARLEELRSRHEAIGEVRGRGTLQGFELVNPDGLGRLRSRRDNPPCLLARGPPVQRAPAGFRTPLRAALLDDRRADRARGADPRRRSRGHGAGVIVEATASVIQETAEWRPA